MGKTQRIIGAVLILVALGLAGYAWVLSQRMTAKQREAQPQMQAVVVASARIPAGSVITPEMVRPAMFPSRPEGAYSDVAAVTGKTTASDIAAGEPLLRDRLEGGGRAVMQHLEAGQRAVAVRVDEVIAVGNRLSPGDMVDVYVTLRRNNEEIPDTQSRLLLEKLPVLAFGAKDAPVAKGGEGAAGARNATDIPKTAVLAVKLEDVDKLALAADSGRLLLALRPRETAGDAIAATVTPTGGGTMNVGAKPAADAAAQAKLQPVALTLRDLVGNAKKTGAVAVKGGVKVASNVSSGAAVTVMHGLKEKTIYLETGARP
ncbi:MAG: Flp pilus assembly protein CpaB [Sulfuricella sp.]|nr:Flp pilus assembly protein CpaB [Sulfuricella sp.]